MTGSIKYSSEISSHVPIDSSMLFINAASSSVARLPRTSTEAPAFTIDGVFGITRITLASDDKFPSISLSVIPMAMETKSCPRLLIVFTSSSAVLTTPGLTAMNTMSDFSATSRLSVTASAPKSRKASSESWSEGWALAIICSLFVNPNQ